jgi:hypothetical protein
MNASSATANSELAAIFGADVGNEGSESGGGHVATEGSMLDRGRAAVVDSPPPRTGFI